MVLAQCSPSSRVRLLNLRVAPQFLLRLSELGLRPGVELGVVSKAAFGGMIVNVGGTRVAVDRGSSRLLDVEVLS